MNVTLYIVRYSYCFQFHLAVWAEEVPKVFIHINSVLFSYTPVFPVCSTWPFSQSGENHTLSAGENCAEVIVWKTEEQEEAGEICPMGAL
jgi:hypothetical protein